MNIFDIYVLNLLAPLAMFVVLIFRACLELRNCRLIWRKLEWRQTYRTMGRILKAEKDLFSKVEGGDELYRMLCEIFMVKDEQA